MADADPHALLLLPVGPHEAALGEDLRGARAWPCTSGGRRAPCLPRPGRGHDRAHARATGRPRGVRPAGRRTCIRSPSSAARSPVTMTRPACSSSGSKSTSQIQETSCPSAIASLSAIDQHWGDADLERAHDLVRSRGVLDEQQHDRLPAGRDPLEPSERRTEAREARADVLERRSDGKRQRGGRGGVVDVVEPRQRELDLDRSPGVRSRKRDECSPRSSISVATTSSSGRWWSQRRAAVVAQVPDVDRRVLVRSAAAHAVLRVGGVLQRGSRLPRVVEAEPERGAALRSEVSDDRIVGVDDEDRRRREQRDSGAPALGHDLELPVPIELVAEEVPERDGSWACARRGPRAARPRRPRTGRGRLRRPGDESRCDSRTGGSLPPGSTRAVAVAAEDLGRHRRRRGLAVGRRNESDALGESRSELVDRAGVEPPQDLARDVVPPPRPDRARERADRASGGGLDGEANGHGGERTERAGRADVL